MDSITALREGATINDRYVIDRLLGQGGMGRVYLVQDTLISGEGEKRHVALKILRSDLCADEKYRKSFLREVQCTREVTHVNVVRTFDVERFRDQLYFTMEFVDGVPLSERLGRAPLQFDIAILILLDTLRGFEAIHQKGIVHRDLKPANTLITRTGVIKIADFGIARPATADVSQSREVVGTALYMSPELWLGEEVTDASDIYALGIIAYEMLTGVVPFDGAVEAEVMCKHLEQKPLPLLEVNHTIPGWANDLVMSMVHKVADERPTCSEIFKVIEANFDPERSNFSIADIFSSQKAFVYLAEEPDEEEYGEEDTLVAPLAPVAPDQSRAPQPTVVVTPPVKDGAAWSSPPPRHYTDQRGDIATYRTEPPVWKPFLFAAVRFTIGAVVTVALFALLWQVKDRLLSQLPLILESGSSLRFVATLLFQIALYGAILAVPLLLVGAPTVALSRFKEMFLGLFIYCVVLVALLTTATAWKNGTLSLLTSSRVIASKQLKEGFEVGVRAMTLSPVNLSEVLGSKKGEERVIRESIVQGGALFVYLCIGMGLFRREILSRNLKTPATLIVIGLAVIPQVVMAASTYFLSSSGIGKGSIAITVAQPVPLTLHYLPLSLGALHWCIIMSVAIAATARRRPLWMKL